MRLGGEMEHPDYIEVLSTHRAVLEADRADVIVKVAGSSLFHGQAALQKAQEVAALVADLKAYGVAESQIRLQNVRAETSGGTLTRSSSATYWLLIQDVALAKFADVLGIVTGRKNAAFEDLHWRYPDHTAVFDGLREQCLERIAVQAGQVARSLNVRLLGVYELTERQDDDSRGYVTGLASVKKARQQSLAVPQVTQEDLGLEVSHAKELELTLRAKYRISEFEN